MQKLHQSWLAIVILVLFSNLTFAIDNPDAPDFIAEFEVREKPLIAAIEKPTNTTGDYAVFYASYLKFLDKELNTVYKTLRTKLPADKQKQLKASQVSWIKYRDLEFMFIDSTWNNKDFGTSSGISRGQYKASVVRDRVIQLMHYAKTF
ncbi:MAG: lysozyme inhibitor LprI family protein [Cellvibrio sp.]|uniref:lysozyme inhibitor LprI family protein n=1 Tax=Cellvibrio sp. TaxID=1965322 RepID=UPI0031A14BEC